MDAHEAVALTATLRTDSGLFFDFDGTLAAIQSDPGAVDLPEGTRSSLAGIAARVKRIGVVSARPVDFLAAKLGSLPGIRLYGVYGLETLGSSGELVRHPSVEHWEPTIATVAERAQAELPKDIRIENKRLTLGLHFRDAPKLQPLVEEWAREHAAEAGLRVQRGRMIVELVPPLDYDKGDIVAREIQDLRCAWYFGDDISDMEAFDALDRREDSHPGFLGIKVAVCNPETGDKVREMADFSIDSPDDLSDFLDHLSHAI